MNSGLELYKNNEDVISIHGFSYPTKIPLPQTYFLRGADCWGWATWRRGWKHFNPDGETLLKELARKKLIRRFDLEGSFKFSKMLKDQVDRKNDSWAIRWHASAFLKNKYTLYPGQTLIKNIGLDGSGTHCDTSQLYNTNVHEKRISVKKLPITESRFARKQIKSFLYKTHNKVTSNFFSKNKKIIKKFLPPIFIETINKVIKTNKTFKITGFFKTWDAALAASDGYDHKLIIENVLRASLKVQSGEAIFERDGVTFDRIEYSWPVTAILALSAANNKNILHILDFGGSLGSVFYQNRIFLETFREVKWYVIEQEQLVKVGKKYFENSDLKFFKNKEEINASSFQPSVILFSSSLQYMNDPYFEIDTVISYKPDFFIFDRTLFGNSKEDFVSTQHSSTNDIRSSYPIWVMSEKKLTRYFSKNYDIMMRFSCPEGKVKINGENAEFLGFIFKRRNK